MAGGAKPPIPFLEGNPRHEVRLSSHRRPVGRLRLRRAAGQLSVAPPPAPPAPPPAPPAPPAPPPIALSTSVAQAAAAYEAYVKQASALTPTFADGDAIQASLRQGEAYEPKSLARDTVAYAAVVALQEPTFVQGVRTYAVDPAQRVEIVSKIEADPAYAASFPGAQAAASLIAAKLGADGDAIAKAGYAIKESAYSIQHQKWSSEFVKDRDGRLAMAKQISSVAGTAPAEDGQALMQAAVSGQGLAVTARPPPPRCSRPTPPASTAASPSRPWRRSARRAMRRRPDRAADGRERGRALPQPRQAEPLPVPGRRQAALRGRLLPGPARADGHRRMRQQTAGVVPANSPAPAPKPAEAEKPSTHGRHGKHAAQQPPQQPQHATQEEELNRNLQLSEPSRGRRPPTAASVRFRGRARPWPRARTSAMVGFAAPFSGRDGPGQAHRIHRRRHGRDHHHHGAGDEAAARDGARRPPRGSIRCS